MITAKKGYQHLSRQAGWIKYFIDIQPRVIELLHVIYGLELFKKTKKATNARIKTTNKATKK